MVRLVTLAALSIELAGPALIVAQTAIPVRTQQVVTANLAARQFDTDVPFEERFLAKVKWPDTGTHSITMKYGPAGWQDDEYVIVGSANSATFLRKQLYGNGDAFLPVLALNVGQEYLFLFELKDSVGEVKNTIRVGAKPKTSIANHVDQDLGVLASDRLGNWSIVTSAHFYAVPINKNARVEDLSKKDQILRRVSLFVGLAVAELESDVPVEKFFGVGSPVLGIAVRPIPRFTPLRIGAGLMAVRQKDANPLVDTKHRKIDRFASVTVDFDIKSVFGPLLALAGLK